MGFISLIHLFASKDTSLAGYLAEDNEKRAVNFVSFKHTAAVLCV